LKDLVDNKNFDDHIGTTLVEKIFLDSIPRKQVEIRSIEQVLRPELLQPFLKKVIEEAASVEICWHGTQDKYVDAILDKGLNPSLCSTGAYGVGAYVGTHAGVAHQYADPSVEGHRHMFCTLVVVGNSLVKGVEGMQCNTTATDRLINPTQYCFVHQERLYCSHLVTYKCVNTLKRRTGGGYQDPFQRKLETALCKSARNRNKNGAR
jgi:hypothetical protein